MASLSAALIGSARLESSLSFYRDDLGLDTTDIRLWEGEDFTEYFRLPQGATARVVECAFPGSSVGRVRLAEFNRTNRQEVRTAQVRRFIGLTNLNAYTFDIQDAWRRLRARHTFWSSPARHELTSSTGDPTEVLFEGPDGVPINLVQLPPGEGTRVGQMRRYLESHGVTSTGFTEVVTSAHTVKDMSRALDFHTRVLGMEPIIDEVMSSSESARFLRLPQDAASHIVFLQGNHMFGKVVLISPLNYDVESVVERARPPNIGYLAMSFEVGNLQTIEKTCHDRDVAVWSRRRRFHLPLLGDRERMIVLCPGSDALIELVGPPT